MVANKYDIDLSDAALRSQFAAIQPQIRKHIEQSQAADKSDWLTESVDSAVERAYRLFVRLVQSGSRELAYPTPLAMAAVKLTDSRSLSRGGPE
jgi:hypothetical protein